MVLSFLYYEGFTEDNKGFVKHKSKDAINIQKPKLTRRKTKAYSIRYKIFVIRYKSVPKQRSSKSREINLRAPLKMLMG